MTKVVTEYRSRTPEQTDPFTIEVDYSNEKEIEDQLYELLHSYRAACDAEPKENDPEHEERVSDYQAVVNKSKVALSALKSMFPD